MKFWIRFKRLLKNSVITGIPQIVITRNVFRKTIKLIVFVFCVFGFFWQTFSFLDVYWTYPTIVDVQYSFPDEFELPAISVCSFNGIKSELFCNRFPHHCYPNKSLEEFCSKHTHLCDANYMPANVSFPVVSPRELPPLNRTEYRDMGLQPGELIDGCIVVHSQRIKSCKEPQIVNVFDIKGLPSNCYTYNGLWGQTKGAEQINTKTLIHMIVKSERSQSNQFYTGSPFAFQIALHNPYSILNPFFNGFAVKPCSNYYVFPSQEINRLLPPPYTSACFNYKTAWLMRSGKSPLTKRLCTEECLLNKSIEHYGCVDPYFNRYPNMEPICPDRIEKDLLSDCKKKCPPACYREDFSTDVQELPLITRKHAIRKDNECKSVITFAFNRMVTVKFIYSPKYESVALFSYIGGYLGLWLGISLVAICDVIETTVLIGEWLIQKFKRRRLMRKIYYNQPVTFEQGSKEMWIL